MMFGCEMTAGAWIWMVFWISALPVTTWLLTARDPRLDLAAITRIAGLQDGDVARTRAARRRQAAAGGSPSDPFDDRALVRPHTAGRSRGHHHHVQWARTWRSSMRPASAT